MLVNKIFGVLLVTAAILFFGCSEKVVNTNSSEPVDTSSFSYPFTDGSTWNYTQTYSVSNIRPDSIRHHFSNYPYTWTSTITILYDTVINGITTKCFYELYVQSPYTYHSRHYFGNYDTALVAYGYRFNGGVSFPFRFNRNIHLSFAGEIFDNTFGLTKSFTNISNPNNFSNDSLYLEIPPVRCLVYPIRTGTGWLFKTIDTTLYIHKKYLGFENLTVNGQVISVMKTERKWFGLSGGDFYFYDYHSKFGQMKRDYFLRNLIVTNEFGITIGYYDLHDVVICNSFTIAP